MTTNRYYKIGNTWVAWQEAHNLYGYTKTPSTSITYKSTNPSTWGEPVSPASGYYDGDISDPISGLYFSAGSMGWFDANHMASYGRMPNECVIDDTMFTDGNVVSACARLKVVAGLSPVELYNEQQEVSVSPDYYLIASAINLGWHTLDEWEELGWTTTDPNTLYFGGDFSGNNIRIDSVDGGGGLIDKYASYKALFELRGWEPGGLFIDKPRMMGICGVLTDTSDSVVLVEVPKQLSVGRIEFTGSLAEGGIPESGVMYEGTIIGGILTATYSSDYTANIDEMMGIIEEYVDVILAFRWDEQNSEWLAVNFNYNPPDDNYWWGAVISDDDATTVQNFGINIYPASWLGPYGGGLLWSDDYTFEAIEVYSDIGVPVSGYDITTLDCYTMYVASKGKWYMAIRNLQKDATNIKYWKCRIRRKPTPATLTAYFTSSGSAASSNFGLSINALYGLYDASGNYILYDSSKTYSIESATRLSSGHEQWTQEELGKLSGISHKTVSGTGDVLCLQTGSSNPYYNGIYSITIKAE